MVSSQSKRSENHLKETPGSAIPWGGLLRVRAGGVSAPSLALASGTELVVPSWGVPKKGTVGSFFLDP